jgi:hypothetical protein
MSQRLPPSFATKKKLRNAIHSYFHGNPRNYPEIGRWNISRITDMSNLFRNLNDGLDVTINTEERNAMVATITDWNVAHVRTMAYMFFVCDQFNQNLNWDISNLAIMTGMFFGCTQFNGTLNFTNMRNVTRIDLLFSRCEIFNQPLNWDVSNVTYMESVFEDCHLFNQPLNWNVGSAESMAGMFSGCHHFNQLLEWEVGNVTDMAGMFEDCFVFNQPLRWNVGSVESMAGMFSGCHHFNQLLEWEVGNVTDMSGMFENCHSFNEPLDWYVGRVEDMSDMFLNCRSFNQELEWEVGMLKKASNMFNGCVLFDRPLNNWGPTTTRLRDLRRMFYNCPNFPRHSIQQWACFYYPDTRRIKVAEIFGPNPVNTPLGISIDVMQYYNVMPPNDLPNVIDNAIIERTIYDPIMLEEVSVRDYLNETANEPDDDKHVVFAYQDENNPNNVTVIGVTRKDLKTILYDNDGSAVRYACANVGHSLLITPDMVNINAPLFSNRSIGFHGGLTLLADIKYVIEHPEITMVKLVETHPGSPAVATASLNMLSRFANAVGAAHCQAGTDERIYSLVNISPGTGETTSIEPGETSGGKRKSRHAMRHTKKQRKINKRKTKKPKKRNRGKTKKQY